MARSYTEEEIERALQVRSVLDSAKAACHVLSEKYELTIPVRTLQQWVSDTHAQRYQAIRATIAPKIRQAIASESEDLAQYIGLVERMAIERVEEMLPTMDGKDAALALKNLSGAKQGAIDKALVLRGEANQITEQRTPAEIINAMKTLGITVKTAETIDGTAEEVIEDAQEAYVAGDIEVEQLEERVGEALETTEEVTSDGTARTHD